MKKVLMTVELTVEVADDVDTERLFVDLTNNKLSLVQETSGPDKLVKFFLDGNYATEKVEEL